MEEEDVGNDDGGGGVDWERDVNEYNVTIIIDGTALTREVSSAKRFYSPNQPIMFFTAVEEVCFASSTGRENEAPYIFILHYNQPIIDLTRLSSSVLMDLMT